MKLHKLEYNHNGTRKALVMEYRESLEEALERWVSSGKATREELNPVLTEHHWLDMAEPNERRHFKNLAGRALFEDGESSKAGQFSGRFDAHGNDTVADSVDLAFDRYGEKLRDKALEKLLGPGFTRSRTRGLNIWRSAK